MGQDTKIEWTHHTFNPWRGCTKVSAGCDHCYAETMSKRNPRALGVWGDDGTRVIASEAYWQQPLRWDREAAAAGERHRVFCASLADVFEERRELIEPRMRLFQLIGRTPHLDWLLLTKRPRTAVENWPLWCGFWAGVREDVEAVRRVARNFVLPNVWVGVSVEDQARADERIPLLLQLPARVRFLSVEPLLGPVDLRLCPHPDDVMGCRRMPDEDSSGAQVPCSTGRHWINGVAWDWYATPRYPDVPARHCGTDWVIVGGESGPGARPCNVAWVRSIVEQCQAAGVPCFVKQLGTVPVESNATRRAGLRSEPREGGGWTLRMEDRKGGDMEEWPESLRVREFPIVGE